jgi:hypothetical protein
MSSGCWIDWSNARDRLHGQVRIFGPTLVEPELLGLTAGSEEIAIRAGPTSIATVHLAGRGEITLQPGTSLGAIASSDVRSIRLRAA